MSRVQEFYAGKTIFITGGTGFMGKILVEKLLRSCSDIRKIYLLIRAKKGKSPQERIDALLADAVFDVLRENYPDFSRKIAGVSGDIAQKGLGLSTTDQTRLIEEVSVIFHLAATVRFTEKLDTAVAINVNSVKYIVEIAEACKNLEVGIYVSTAYSHCPRKSINEELYPPPLSYERVNELIEDAKINKMSEDEMQNFTHGVLGKWPNTYSFTKAIAESIVAESAKEIPFAVFRPSIVANAYREPIPGWVFGATGLSGIVAAMGLGIMHVMWLDGDIRFDIVPVDYVCNALISSAWETAITERRQHHEIPVYNYVSGNENPIKLGQLIRKIHHFATVYPTNRAVYYPSVISTKSKWLCFVLHLSLHFIPALIIDSIARLFGRQLGLYKVSRRIEDAILHMGYFATQQWDFENQRVQNLWEQMGPADRQIFPFHIRNVDWDEHVMKMIKGIWKHILGDVDGNMKRSRQRHFYLYIVHTIVRLAVGIFVLWMALKLFHGYDL